MSVLRAVGRPRAESVLTGAEILAGVAAPTVVVACLQGITSPRGLGVVYLLGVLAVAIRRGEAAALLTALLSVLTLNYLFIPPRHRLAIAHSDDLVELVVFLIAAAVVGRLAGQGRQRAAEAESRARLAAAREREAMLLAQAASAILAGPSLHSQLRTLGRRIAEATGASEAEVELTSAPSHGSGWISIRLGSRERSVWLAVTDDLGWTHPDLERIAEPLGRLIDVALERERVVTAAAEAETASRAEAARTAILHAISHDLRSPLTAIATAGAALRSPGLTEHDRRELIGVVEAESARLAKLVDDLLDLSKIQAGATAPQPDWCDMHDVVGSAAAHFVGDHPVRFDLPADLPMVRADAAQLERVFCNLIDNALKFSPADAPIVISGGTGGGRVTVRVTDQGRGIPSSQRPYVFEPFFRGRSDGAGASGGGRAELAGSGLGLAICRGFVEANGGRIVLQSGAGRGTSFAVSFPLPEQPKAPAPDAPLSR
jgi:two-component system sensor histidine kinase KdpD